MNSVLKRVVVGFVGGAVTLVGVIALIAPGPGWLIIFTGLGILATEFAWAAQALAHAKGMASRAANAARIKKEHQLILLAVGTFISLVFLVIYYKYLR